MFDDGEGYEYQGESDFEDYQECADGEESATDSTWESGEIDDNGDFENMSEIDSEYEITQREYAEIIRNRGNELITKECGDCYVADGIGEDFKKWTSATPVFISAQTGRGKNTFIYETLRPFVENKNKTRKPRGQEKILMLVNRVALGLQAKKYLAEVEHEDLLGSVEISDSDENVTNDYREHHTFDCVTVLSYHELLNKIKDLQLDEYAYVVCDECHFFTSDAMFNPFTRVILQAIICNFAHAVRIYMSATFDECLGYIIHDEGKGYMSFHENEHWSDESNTELFGRYSTPPTFPVTFAIKYYVFMRNYSYLDARYYGAIDELYDVIVADDEQWLIFIDDKDECARVREELEQRLGETTPYRVVSISADSKNTKPKGKKTKKSEETEERKTFKEIAEKGVLASDIKALITTSVIYNGVNLRGENLKNVVITSFDKVSCVQMVGRVRVAQDAKRDSVKLYIKKPNLADFILTSKRLEKQEEIYQMWKYETYDFYQTYYSRAENIATANRLFYRKREDPAKVRPNKMAVDLLEKQQYLNESRLSRANDYLGLHGLLEEQLSWFGKKYNVGKDIEVENIKGKYLAFLGFWNKYNGSIGVKIPVGEVASFRMEFFNKYHAVFGWRDKDKDRENERQKEGYNYRILNKINRDLKAKGFVKGDIWGIKDKKGEWEIERLADNSESDAD